MQLAEINNQKRRFRSLLGHRFSRLLVIQQDESQWICLCVCGQVTRVSSSNLVRGHTRSCGCLRRDALTKLGGKSKTPEHRIYHNAKARCVNSNNTAYQDYGGRGIEFRFASFTEFLNDIGPRPSHDYSLDRIDVNGHYEVGNVRWASRREQNRNKRSNHWITFNGKTQTLKDWCVELDIHVPTALYRLTTRQWCVPCALTIKPNAGKCKHRKLTGDTK